MKFPFDEIGKVKDGVVDVDKFEKWFTKQGLQFVKLVKKILRHQ